MKSLELLKNLIKINSTNGTEGENEGVEYLKKVLTPFAGKIKIIGKEHKNLLAFFGDLKSKNILLINGHIDTVGAEQKEWISNPFELRVEDDFLYGRGVGDMKGGIASSICALIKAKEDGLLKNKQVIFVASCDEENGADSEFGSQAVVDYFLKNGIEPLGCIIPEPNTMGKPLRINLGHRGLVWIKAISSGTKMHSGLIKNENNAITNMVDFLSVLRKKLTNQPKKDKKGIPESSARVTSIKSESELNIVPSYCECFLDVRISPFDKNKNIIKKIQRLSINFGVKIEILKNTPSSTVKKNAKIVKKLVSCFENLEQSYEIGFSSATNDAHFYNGSGIPTVVSLGVDAENVHALNEKISLKSLKNCEKLFYEFIKEW